MNDGLIDQVVQTLSQQIHKAATEVSNKAPFAYFRSATIRKHVGDHRYRVSLDDRLIDLPVYGDCKFDRGEQVYIVSPRNSMNYHEMFILGKTINSNVLDADHKTLMEVVAECDRKLDKAAVVQEEGGSTVNVMSQKAVTEALNELRKNPGVKQIICGDKVLSMSGDGIVTIPYATTTNAGVVKSSTDENEIKVNATGIMELGALDIKRVQQHAEDIVVLDAGSA